ncbi:MAG: AAA family ATPase [Vibrio splendidus]
MGNTPLISALRNQNERGNAILKELRTNGAIEKVTIEPRKYGAQEACAILGRSLPWLRDNSRHIEASGNGRRYYSLEDLREMREEHDLLFSKPEGGKAIVKVVSNFKGGVGKTTSAVHEAHYMATYQGMNVLVVDLDPQASSTFCLGAIIPDLDITASDTILNALTKDIRAFGDIIRETYVPGVDLIPSNLSLQSLDHTLLGASSENIERMGPIVSRLDKVLKLVENHYDLVIIDCPPNMGLATGNALVAAQALTVAVPPALYDLGSAILFNKSIAEFLEATGETIDSYRVLLTKNPQTASSKRTENKIRQIFEESVHVGTILQTTEFEKASECFTTVYDLSRDLTSKKTYERAIESLNIVHEEAFGDYLEMWGVEQ